MEKLEREFEILDTKVLEPYEKDHAMFLMRKGE
jgi:fibrillarin-like rRNA methylase